MGEKNSWREQYNKYKDSYDRATAKYQKEKMQFMGLRWHKLNDADILAKLDSVPNKVNYIRQLIREDIQRTGWRPPMPTPGVSPEEAYKMLGM